MKFLPILALLVCMPGVAHDPGGVIGRSEGERLEVPFANWIVKASPKSGTQGSELHWFSTGPGFSTGLHVHLEADELFYVLSGTGMATVNDEESAIGEGDVIFIPKGVDHKLVSTGNGENLELLFFLDKPGLADGAREVISKRHNFPDDPQATLELRNEITSKYGTIYKTSE